MMTKKMMSSRTKTRLVIALFAILISVVLLITSYLVIPKSNHIYIEDKNLKEFTIEELSNYDGSNPELPIFICLNGYIYDVTEGKNFYQKGATYNFLAGKDSSQELNIIGGDIIQRKYKVIGILK